MTQTPPDTIFYTTLKNRGLIHIEGEGRHNFLQNLITNDIHKLTPGHALYTCLLNPQGKFLHDFFITQGDNFILLDCEGGERAQDLYQRLNMYRLRADVQISVEDSVPVYAVIGTTPENATPDPRHPNMGYRSFEKPAGIPEAPFEEWDARRIRLCIPDGSRDMVIGGSTMLESHIDKLNGVSFDKGCYIGQELTARMHYRGLAKKHLYTIEDENLPDFGEAILNSEGKRIGDMRSKCGNIGIALLKDKTL